MFRINWWRTLGGLEKNEATDTGDTERIRAVHEEDAAGVVSGRDGAGGAVGGVVCADRAGVSKSRARATAGGRGADAADVLFAAVVQPVGPGGGRSALRVGVVAGICGHRSGAGAGAG